MDLKALKSEIDTDPERLGYASHLGDGKRKDPKGQVVQSDFGAVAKLLNTVRDALVYRNDLSLGEIVNAMPASEFLAMTALQVAQLQLLLAAGPLNLTLPNVREIVLGLGSSAVKEAMATVAQRAGSRAEELFGPGTVVTEKDIAGTR